MDETTRRLLIVGGVLLLLAVAVSTVTGGMVGGHMHMFDPETTQGRGWMWGLGVGLHGLMMVLFWGALIIGIVLAVRHVGHGGPVPPATTPLDILKRRYAAGEITREQYDQMRRDLDEPSR